MKLSKALILLASIGYLSIVISFPLVNNADGPNVLNDGYVNTTTINDSTEGSVKRQTKVASDIVRSIFNNGSYIPDSTEYERSQFTVAAVTALRINDGNFNYIICHVDHDYNFQGTQGADWDHAEVDVVIGIEFVTTHFDIVIGKAGSFTRYGDGGFINWAYCGNVASRTEYGDSTVVVFNAP